VGIYQKKGRKRGKRKKVEIENISRKSRTTKEPREKGNLNKDRTADNKKKTEKRRYHWGENKGKDPNRVVPRFD